MNRLMLAVAAFLVFVGVAYAGSPCFKPVGCTTTKTVTQTVVVGHKKVWYNRPVYKRIGTKRVEATVPIKKKVEKTITIPAPCQPCQQPNYRDIPVRFLFDCFDKQGRHIWVYKGADGREYWMPEQQHGPNDRIRVFADGRPFLWAIY